MPQDDQCHLIGTIKELLDKGLELHSPLKTIFFPSELDGEKQRNRAAQNLMEELVYHLPKVKPSEACSHPPLSLPMATNQFQCNLIWRSNAHDSNALNGTCDGKRLLECIEEITKHEDHVFKSLTQSFKNKGKLPSDDLAHHVRHLITLMFQRDSSVSVSTDPVHDDFQGAFRGSSLKLLQHFIIRANAFINRGHNYDVIYAKTLPILQSSGTGKTKLAVQLSAHQAGLLICTRNQNNSLPTSFPPFDESVHTYFQETLKCQWNSQSLPQAKLTIQHK